MARGKYKQKKTAPEVKQYRNSLGQNKIGMEETFESNNSLLTGSDSFASEYKGERDKNIPVAPKELSLIFRDWIKNNWVNVVVTMIGIPFIGWVAINIISLEKAQAVYEYRIDQLESDLTDVADDILDKDYIELQITDLKDDIEKFNMSNVQERISVLENQVESLK